MLNYLLFVIMYLRWGEGDCLAAIDRYRMKDGSDDYIADNSSDIHKSKRNGEDFGYIDGYIGE